MDSLSLFGKWLKKLLILNISYLAIMSLFRFATLEIYGQPQDWTTELFSAFWMGMRFDSVVLFYFAILPALYLVMALHSRNENFWEMFGRFIRPYYIFVLALASILLAIDIQYYSYFQDHFNILVFGLIEDDTVALLWTFWKNYPVIWYSLFAAAGVWILSKFIGFALSAPSIEKTKEKGHWTLMPLVSLVLIVVIFLGGRGSFGLFPLGQTDTVVSRDPFINHLATNGIWALNRAFKLRRQQNRGWDNNMKFFGYGNPKEAFADFYQIPVAQVPDSPMTLFHHRTPKNPWAEATHPNVVVFMMESFGGHWLKYQSPSFNLLGEMEKHIHEDIFLRNFLPSASSTTGSLSSIMISAPQRPIGNFLTESEYLQVPFRSSPARTYSRAGYETHFVYGGNPGWRDMNKFARYQGFDHVEGEVDIEAKLGPIKERHDWGIYDEDVFRYVKTLLQEAKKPQMILVMTTTNHPPYQIPSNFHPPQQTIPKELESRLIGDRKIAEARFKTYYYSSQKLGEFLTDIKSSPLGEKTLVAATGDHSFWLINFSDEELLQKWAVPFYLYAPKALHLSIDKDTFGSHMDIFPTLYELSLSDVEYDALGVNLADPKAPHYALHSAQLIVGPEGGAFINRSPTAPSYFDWAGHFEKLIPGKESAVKKAMATRYRALMSILDYYFMAEKKAGKR